MTTIRKIGNGYLLKRDGKEEYYYSVDGMERAIQGLDSKYLHDIFEENPEIKEIMIQTSINYIPVTDEPKVDASDLIESIVKWKEEFHNMHNIPHQRDVIRDLLIKHGVTKGES